MNVPLQDKPRSWGRQTWVSVAMFVFQNLGLMNEEKGKEVSSYNCTTYSWHIRMESRTMVENGLMNFSFEK